TVFYKMFDNDFFKHLNPINIAHRLWTTVHCLNMKNEAGSTASVTAYDGKNTFVTATLGDSTAFVAIYGKNNKILGVRRLHDALHNVKSSASEQSRILE